MKTITTITKICLILTTVLATMNSQAADTDISALPLEIANAVQPNIIFALDDSGSMDFEVLLDSNDGALWWEGNSKTFWDANGKINYNDSGDTGSSNGNMWYKYVYLFPNGTGSDKRQYGDSSYDHFAIPPIPAYAFMRCSDYNPLYYNPVVTYQPWQRAYINSKVETYADANKTQAKSHPVFTGSSGQKLDLTTNNFSTSSNFTFKMFAGMPVPGATISGIQRKSGTSWINVTSDTVVPDGSTWDVAIPYYPATYYVNDSTCNSGVDCATAPDGTKLRRIEIKSGNTYPSGRNYAEEMQNFANWYTYYRKRKLMLSASMGEVLTKVTSIRGGLVQFNNRNSVTMYNFDSNDPAQNNMYLIGKIYQNPASGGTPTRDTLQYVGEQYRTNNNIITKSCQFNAAMVLTDGFSVTSGPTPPSYNSSLYGGTPPYTTTYAKSLADIALSYYTNNLRTDLTAGLVPVNEDNNKANADLNTNLHMNTYALNIGPKGTIYGTSAAAASDPFTTNPVWPNPNITRSPAAIDDLWHATINGRGVMTDAADSIGATNSLREILFDVLNKAHSSSGVSVENVYLDQVNNAIYATTHHLGYGDLKKYTINLTNGTITKSNFVWSAKDALNNMLPSNRKIITYNGSGGITFQLNSIPSSMISQLGTLASLLPITTSERTADGILDWVRGDMTLDPNKYRTRSYLLGSIVHSSPVIVGGALRDYALPGYNSFKASMASRTPMVYQPANDGMVHAFDTTSGVERWAYIPGLIFDKLASLSEINYVHEYTVDATPIVADVELNGQWKTMLVGGLGAGGRGYYALDVTSPNASTETEAANKVMWEFPNASTTASVKNNIGLTFGRPKIVKTHAAGWVVLVTSGYNNGSPGDGKGHLFVLNLQTGALIKDISTSVGSASSPSGLAYISAYAPNIQFDPLVEYVYGGDLNGNMWRFDLSSSNVSDWNTVNLATLVDVNGNPQPITVEPELAKRGSERMVIVGTGRLLGQTDITNLAPQTMYGLIDDNTVNPNISPLRSNLTSLNSSVNTGTRGWYYDLLSAGERINTMPVLALNNLFVNVNKPSSDGCSSESYQYTFKLSNNVTLTSETSTGGSETSTTTNNDLANITVNRTLQGHAMATSPSIAVLPDDTLVVITHNTDDTFSTTQITTEAGEKPSAVAWREVVRD